MRDGVEIRNQDSISDVLRKWIELPGANGMFLCTGSILLRAVPQEPDIPPHKSHPHEDNLSSPYHPPKLWVGCFYENIQPALRSLLGAPCSPLGPRKDWKSAESQPSLFNGRSIGVAVPRQQLFPPHSNFWELKP